jgi:LPXTG-motif cell wall-anchored protein
MALNSTPRRRFGVTLGAVLTGVTAGLIGFAGTASAHTPDVKASCEGDTTTLWVQLKSYNGKDGKSNTVKVTDGGQSLVDTTFKSAYEDSFETSGAVDHVFTVTVKAWDDPQGDKGYSFTKELKVEKCVVETTTSTSTETSTSETTPPSETSTSETPTSSSTEAPPVSTTTVAPTTTTTAAVEEAALAETGASIGLPLGIAGVLLVGGGILLFVVRRRGKA